MYAVNLLCLTIVYEIYSLVHLLLSVFYIVNLVCTNTHEYCFKYKDYYKN